MTSDDLPPDNSPEEGAAAPVVRGAFYGRRHGKTLRAQRAATVESRLPALALDLKTPAPADLATLFPVPVREVWLEIGFGGGEHMIHQAETNPDVGIIGCEPFVNGMAKAVSVIGEKEIETIRLHPEDAVFLLDWMPPASVSRIYLLYPDPWPKKRHWKRRFVSAANLDRFCRVLQPGGMFRFASDIDTYVDWTLSHVRAHGGLVWTAETAADWKTPYPGWESTRYEAKALREGRTPTYLTFVKPE